MVVFLASRQNNLAHAIFHLTVLNKFDQLGSCSSLCSLYEEFYLAQLRRDQTIEPYYIVNSEAVDLEVFLLPKQAIFPRIHHLSQYGEYDSKRDDLFHLRESTTDCICNHFHHQSFCPTRIQTRDLSMDLFRISPRVC